MDNWSVGLDVKIVLMTVVKVLRRDGISAKGEATMEEFMGQISRKKAQESQKGLNDKR